MGPDGAGAGARSSPRACAPPPRAAPPGRFARVQRHGAAQATPRHDQHVLRLRLVARARREVEHGEEEQAAGGARKSRALSEQANNPTKTKNQGKKDGKKDADAGGKDCRREG